MSPIGKNPANYGDTWFTIQGHMTRNRTGHLPCPGIAVYSKVLFMNIMCKYSVCQPTNHSSMSSFTVTESTKGISDHGIFTHFHNTEYSGSETIKHTSDASLTEGAQYEIMKLESFVSFVLDGG